MIEAQPGAEVPRAVAHLVLQVKRRLDVPFAASKCELRPRPGIELGGIDDLVLQCFARWRKERIRARFPVVVSAMAGQIAANVSFAIAAILIDDDGRGEIIGMQHKTRITDAARNAEKQRGRERPLKINLAGVLAAGSVLPLRHALLDQVVRNQVTQRIAREAEPQPVIRRKIMLERGSKTSRVSQVAEIL